MSFQRMLMMATREVRPYLPHPEALVALYVPRWQTEQGNTLTDWSGNGNDYSPGIVIYNEDGSVTQSGRWQSNNLRTYVTSNNITTLVKRTINPSAPQGPGTSGAYGLGLIYSGESTTYIHDVYYNYVKYARAGMTDIRLSTEFDGDGWSAMRQDGGVAEYNGEMYNVGTNQRITRIRINRVTVPLWQCIYIIAFWRITLTDEEIEMAQHYLDTASLEDYMMSRL